MLVGAGNCNSAGPTSGVCGSCSDNDSWGCSEHKTAAQELVAAMGMLELRIEESWSLRSSSERCRRLQTGLEVELEAGAVADN